MRMTPRSLLPCPGPCAPHMTPSLMTGGALARPTNSAGCSGRRMLQGCGHAPWCTPGSDLIGGMHAAHSARLMPGLSSLIRHTAATPPANLAALNYKLNCSSRWHMWVLRALALHSMFAFLRGQPCYRQLGQTVQSSFVCGVGRLLRDDTEAAQALAATEAARDEERRRAQAAVREALSRKVRFQ